MTVVPDETSGSGIVTQTITRKLFSAIGVMLGAQDRAQPGRVISVFEKTSNIIPFSFCENTANNYLLPSPILYFNKI